MVEITAVHMEGGTYHEHIASVRWKNPQTSATGSSTRATMVDWLRTPGNAAFVSDSRGNITVGVVNPPIGSPFLRTHADGRWTDNLLSLPRY